MFLFQKHVLALYSSVLNLQLTHTHTLDSPTPLPQVMTKTRFPRWRKTFDIPFPKPLVELKERMVKIVVYDWDKFLHNKFMGEVSECPGADSHVGRKEAFMIIIADKGGVYMETLV